MTAFVSSASRSKPGRSRYCETPGGIELWLIRKAPRSPSGAAPNRIWERDQEGHLSAKRLYLSVMTFFDIVLALMRLSFQVL